MNKDSSSVETFSSFLLLVPENSSKFCLFIASTNTFPLIFSIKWSHLTAPSSSRGIDASCRSKLIMNFDTAKQTWLNGFGLMSIQILSLIGTWLEDKFTTGFGRGLAFATGPCTYEQLNVLSGYFLSRFCDVFVDTIHNANPWNCSVFTQWFDHDINAITSFVRIEFHIQDWADLRIWTNPPTRSRCCEVSRLSVFWTCCLHNLRSFFNCNEELSFHHFH